MPQGTTPQGTAPLGAAFNAGTDELTIEDIRMATQIIRVGKHTLRLVDMLRLTLSIAHIVNHMRRSSGGTALDTLNALLFVLPPSLDTTPVDDITGVDIEREDSTTAFADNDDEPRFEMMNAVSAIYCRPYQPYLTANGTGSPDGRRHRGWRPVLCLRCRA